MIFNILKLSALAIAGIPALGAPQPATLLTGFPFTDETLNYTVNWPSGLSLGEGHLRARHAGKGWAFEFSLDASVPGFDVKDHYAAHSTQDFCSLDFSKDSAHGTRKTKESETVEHDTVTRVTEKGGGKSEFSVPDCVRDGLTLLFYARRELGQGRVPPAQQILFGGLYQATLQYAGAQTIQIGEKPEQSDKVLCSVKGPNSSAQFEIYFARDPARTPLSFKVPLSLGKFSMELVR